MTAAKLWLFLVLSFALNASSLARDHPLPPERRKLADQMLKARLDYAKSKDYNPYATEPRDATKLVWSLLEKKEYTKAIAEADRGLKVSEFDVMLLMAKAAAYRGLNDAKHADEFTARWMAVADSILYRGDGRSPKTAFTVINVTEEYAIAYLLGLQFESQFLVQDSGKMFDQMIFKHTASGKEVTLYFNVDLPLRALNSELAGKKNDAKKR